MAVEAGKVSQFLFSVVGIDPVSGHKTPRRNAYHDSAVHGRALSEVTNVHDYKEPYQKACADYQHSERRSIEKACARLDRCLDDVSVFFVHEAAPRVQTLNANGWMQNRFRREEMNWAAPFVLSTFVDFEDLKARVKIEKPFHRSA